MDITRLGSRPQPVGPEAEDLAVKPPSPGTLRETSQTGSPGSASGQAAGQANVSKRPLDEPALKSFLSEKLGGAIQGGTGYTAPSTRMDDNRVDTKGWGEEDGADAGPEAPSGDGWEVGKNADPKSLNSNDGNVPKSGDDDNGPTRGVGFGFTGRPGREGDGHTTATNGGKGTSSGSAPSGSTNPSTSSSSSGTTGTSSTTGVHHKK